MVTSSSLNYGTCGSSWSRSATNTRILVFFFLWLQDWHVDAAALNHVAGTAAAVKGDPLQRRTRQVRCARNCNFFKVTLLLLSFCSSRDLQAEVELVLPDTSCLFECNQLQLTSALISSVCGSAVEWDREGAWGTVTVVSLQLSTMSSEDEKLIWVTYLTYSNQTNDSIQPRSSLYLTRSLWTATARRSVELVYPSQGRSHQIIWSGQVGSACAKTLYPRGSGGMLP